MLSYSLTGVREHQAHNIYIFRFPQTGGQNKSGSHQIMKPEHFFFSFPMCRLPLLPQLKSNAQSATLAASPSGIKLETHIFSQAQEVCEATVVTYVLLIIWNLSPFLKLRSSSVRAS